MFLVLPNFVFCRRGSVVPQYTVVMETAKYANLERIATRVGSNGLFTKSTHVDKMFSANVIDAIVNTEEIKERIRVAAQNAIVDYLRDRAIEQNITDSSICALETYLFPCDEVSTTVIGIIVHFIPITCCIRSKIKELYASLMIICN